VSKSNISALQHSGAVTCRGDIYHELCFMICNLLCFVMCICWSIYWKFSKSYQYITRILWPHHQRVLWTNLYNSHESTGKDGG